MKRIMYIECKDGGLDGPGRICWVEMSRTSRPYFYQGRRFQKTRSGYKYNCFEEKTGTQYWLSGPKKRDGAKLYGGIVDDDARVEFWTKIPGATGTSTAVRSIEAYPPRGIHIHVLAVPRGHAAWVINLESNQLGDFCSDNRH